MPEMIPVGNTIVPPNPQQGLNTLSSIIGIKQQQQTLQTGQALQQTAQAQAQQHQLQAGQAQGVQDFFSSWDPSQHVADDGTTDIESAIKSSQYQNSGNAKPAIMQSLLDIKNKQLTNKQALAGLNTTLLNQLGTQVGAVAKDDDVVADTPDPSTGVNAGRAKVSQLLTNFAKLSPDAARVAQIYGPMVDHAPPGKLSTAVQALQLQAQSASEQQTQQNPRQLAVPTGAATNVYNVQPSTGLQTGQQPAQSITQQPGPTETPGYREQVEYQQQQGQQFATRQQSGIAMANQSPQALDALSRARAILDKGTWTGGGVFTLTKELKNTLAGMGFDTESATNANELVKNLARYEATRANGVGNTDAARNLVSTGSPSTIVDSQAAKNIITQSMANEMAIKGYANKVGPVGSPQEGMQKEQEFRNTPNLIEGYEYGLMRSPEEADQFAKRYGLTKQQIAETRAKMRQQGLL